MFPLYSQNNHWQAFFPNRRDIKFLQDTIEERWIQSDRHKIHLDIYEVSKSAPTVIYCHGLSSCGRIMGHIVRHIYKRGYNVICPDFVGFGMTTEKYGSGTISDFTQNTLDVIRYAKRRYSGRRFLTGISMGGALSYYAATEGADVSAIASYCLFDFSHPGILPVTATETMFNWIKKGVQMAAHVLPDFYVPAKAFLDINRLCDDTQIIQLFKKNPLVIKHYTLEAILSLLVTAPHIPFQEFERLPVLVLHAKNDRLIPEKVSINSYNKLPCKKKYVSIENCGHAPIHNGPIQKYVKAMDQWFSVCS